MSDPVSSPLRRYRRRILGWGSLGVVVLCAVAAPLFLRSVERDLEHRVPSELAERGFVGVSAAFSGQDGVLRCAAPLAEPEDAIDAAIDVWGVRAIELDRSCRVGGTPAEVTDDVTTTSPDETVSGPSIPPDTAAAPDEASPFDSVMDVVTSGPQFSILASLIAETDLVDTFATDGPFTLFAPSDDAFEAVAADTLADLREDGERLDAVLRHHAAAGSLASGELESGALEMLDGTTVTVTVIGREVTIGDASVTEPDLSAANGVVHVIDRVLLDEQEPTEPDGRSPTVSATLTAGHIELDGNVADESQRTALVGAAARVLDPTNVVDQLVVDSGTEIDGPTVSALAELVAAMPPHLVSGESGIDGTELYSAGVFVDDDARIEFLAVADFLSADVELARRPTASAGDAAALESELNAFVVDNPIRFAPASADVAAEAPAVLDQLAGIARQFNGVTVTVEGHTDSDGVPAENQVLSEERAQTVLAALAARGVPAGDLTAVGLGSTQPILVGETEDKDASRRIEFRVTTEPGA
jgi:OOP family OmpA-OmpF porin